MVKYWEGTKYEIYETYPADILIGNISKHFAISFCRVSFRKTKIFLAKC